MSKIRSRLLKCGNEPVRTFHLRTLQALPTAWTKPALISEAVRLGLVSVEASLLLAQQRLHRIFVWCIVASQYLEGYTSRF